VAASGRGFAAEQAKPTLLAAAPEAPFSSLGRPEIRVKPDGAIDMTVNGHEEPLGSTARFAAQGEDEVLRLCVILSLGMCEAISHGLIGSDYACHRLFGPALLATARAAGAAAEFAETLSLATELDAVARLAPDALASSLDDLKRRLLQNLRAIVPGPIEGEKWLVTR
jgi:hypothetical protein